MVRPRGWHLDEKHILVDGIPASGGIFDFAIYLFNNAKIIIGAHGASFANLAFCEPNTNIIEIKPSTHPNNVNKRISQINNLNYKLIETKELDKDQKKFADIYLPIDKLEQSIKSFD